MFQRDLPNPSLPPCKGTSEAASSWLHSRRDLTVTLETPENCSYPPPSPAPGGKGSILRGERWLVQEAMGALPSPWALAHKGIGASSHLPPKSKLKFHQSIFMGGGVLCPSIWWFLLDSYLCSQHWNLTACRTTQQTVNPTKRMNGQLCLWKHFLKFLFNHA